MKKNLARHTTLGFTGARGQGQSIYNRVQQDFYSRPGDLVLLFYALALISNWFLERLRLRGA